MKINYFGWMFPEVIFRDICHFNNAFVVASGRNLYRLELLQVTCDLG